MPQPARVPRAPPATKRMGGGGEGGGEAATVTADDSEYEHESMEALVLRKMELTARLEALMRQVDCATSTSVRASRVRVGVGGARPRTARAAVGRV